ncbi:MAG TPA: ribonuclease HII [Candidatus Polarisedimenticolia bacterium]|nr:ribonuclease HII [Candidatus Polarisedimenticolia bacterium]
MTSGRGAARPHASRKGVRGRSLSRPRAASWDHEEGLEALGYGTVAGIDEVGRGCLAGPVIAAAVVLDVRQRVPGLRDSKQLTPTKREFLAGEIARRAVACGLGVVEAEEIDRTDILRATLKAMGRAVEALPVRPDFLLVDALRIPGVSIPQRGIVRGDQISASIAAASIVAKVYRDEMMRSLHPLYPVYDFNANKGYGTAAHLEALRRHGASPLHRTTFRGVPPLPEVPGPPPPRSR